MMPILIAFEGVLEDALLLLLVLLAALVLLLLLLPHAATHSAQMATIGIRASRPNRRRPGPLSNLVTSSATFPCSGIA
jgi:hypothetical protein